MKKKFFIILFIFLFSISKAQTLYFKGEWTTANTTMLFTCLLKLEIKSDSIVTGEFIWTYISADSSDADMMDTYKDKKNLRAKEFVTGKYNQHTGDIEVTGEKLDDPHEIIGLTQYFLKLSADMKNLSGYTYESGGEEQGLFHAIDDGKNVQRQFRKYKSGN